MVCTLCNGTYGEQDCEGDSSCLCRFNAFYPLRHYGWWGFKVWLSYRLVDLYASIGGIFVRASAATLTAAQSKTMTPEEKARGAQDENP